MIHCPIQELVWKTVIYQKVSNFLPPKLADKAIRDGHRSRIVNYFIYSRILTEWRERGERNREQMGLKETKCFRFSSLGFMFH